MIALRDWEGAKRRWLEQELRDVGPSQITVSCGGYLAAEKIPWLFSGIVVKASYLAGHRDVLAQFLKASIEGNYRALTDETRAKEVLARETRVVDPKIIDTSYNDFKQQSPANLEPSRAGAQNIIEQFPVLKSRSIDDYIDGSILDDLKKEGFFAEIERKYAKH